MDTINQLTKLSIDDGIFCSDTKKCHRTHQSWPEEWPKFVVIGRLEAADRH